MQKTSTALEDHRLGPNKTLNVIIMNQDHPDRFRGLYDPNTESVVLYPNRGTSTTPHEVAHVYVDKHHGTLTQPKGGGVNEGFAKITAHRVTGDGGASPPSADNVSDILDGTNCTPPSPGWKCNHDIGNLVFEAYETLVDEMGAHGSFDVYRKALSLIKGRETPAALHRAAAEILEEDLPSTPPAFLPPISDPFVLGDWEAWLLIYWTWC